jgi:uncharacterized protein
MAVFCPHCGLRVGTLPAPVLQPEGAASAVEDEQDAYGESRDSPGWLALLPALQLFGAMLATSFAGIIAYKFTATPWVDVSVCAADALLVGMFVWRDFEGVKPALARSRPLPVLKTVLILGSASLLINVYFDMLERIGVPFFELTREARDAGWPSWTCYVLLCVYPAVFEELAFRGVILHRLERVLGDTEAWLVQAAMFSVLHLMPAIFLSHFLLGLLFGWLRRKSGSIYPGMIAHAAWNTWFVWSELDKLG